MVKTTKLCERFTDGHVLIKILTSHQNGFHLLCVCVRVCMYVYVYMSSIPYNALSWRECLNANLYACGWVAPDLCRPRVASREMLLECIKSRRWYRRIIH